jgi:hypothetical protein
MCAIFEVLTALLMQTENLIFCLYNMTTGWAIHTSWWPGQCSQYSDSLWSEPLRVRTPVWVKSSTAVQTTPRPTQPPVQWVGTRIFLPNPLYNGWVPESFSPSPCTRVGTRIFLGGKEASEWHWPPIPI